MRFVDEGLCEESGKRHLIGSGKGGKEETYLPVSA